MSDKRREVAARLRGALTKNEMKRAIDLSTETDYMWQAICCRLADLIEPQQIDENTSDGYHTFRQLYYQRMMLFAVLVKEHKEHSWKTRRHEDGKPCFGGGWFLVTIDTPNGPYGYHYEDEYWDLFDCEEITKAKHWDGYDESDVGRLMSLCV